MTEAVESPARRRTGGPYKGLEHYEEDDWRLFCGRRRELEVIVTNLRARRIMVLYGSSGVGKSSLLRAGVVHHVRELADRNVEEVGVPEYVPVIVSDWRDEPLATLSRAVREAVARFAPHVEPRAAGLADTIDELARAVDSRILVVLDQLEEYFLYHGDGDPNGFVTELTEALVRPRLRASFMLSIREDALAKLDRIRRNVPGLFDTILHLEQLDRDNAREAIVEPLARYDGPGPHAAEDALVTALLDQLAGGAPVPEQAGQGKLGRDGRAPSPDRIDPSYLQLVLARLWESEEDDHMLRLATLERLDGTEAIARRHLDEALDSLPPEERDAAAEVLRFLVTPLGSKIALAAAELGSFTDSDVEPTLERLAAGTARILRTVPPPPGRDGPTRYEIFHDVLGPGVLDWRARYVHAREQDRARAEREALERETEEARRRELAERARARMFRALAAAALAGLVLALAAGAFAWHQKRAAEHQRRLAESRALAAAVPGLLGGHLADALPRALSARDRAGTVEARSALLSAVQRTHGLVRFVRFRKPVETLAAGFDGTFVAALDDGALVFFDRDGRNIGSWPGEHATVESVAFAPNRPRIATGHQTTVTLLGLRRGADGRVSVAKRWSREVNEDQHTIRTVAFSRDGRWLAAGGKGGITVWQLDRSGHPHLVPVTSALATVNRLAFAGRGPLLRAASSRGLLSWDLRRPRHAPRVIDPVPARALALGARDRWAVAERTRVRVGSPSTELRPLPGRAGPSTAVALDPRGAVLAAGDSSGRVALWNLAGAPRLVRTLRGQGARIVSVAFDERGRRLAVASADGTVAVWKVPEGARPDGELDVGAAAVTDAALGRDRTVAIVTHGGALHLGKIESGRLPGVVARRVEHVTSSSDGGSIVAAGRRVAVDGSAASRAPLRVIRVQAPAEDVAVARDGSAAAALRLEPSVLRRDADGRRLPRLEPPASIQAPAISVAMSPDGDRIAAGYFNGAVVLWNSNRGVVLRKRGRPVTSLAFDREGAVLAAGDTGGSIDVWHVAKAGKPTRLVGHDGEVTSVSFAPGERMLASGGSDGVVRLWDPQTGQLLGDPLRVGRPVTAVGFSPDGSSLLALHDRITIWDSSLWRSDKDTLERVRRRFCALIEDESSQSRASQCADRP